MNSSVPLPDAVTLETTYRCNHKCVFCSSPWYAPNSKYAKGEELDFEAWKQAIDLLYGNGAKYFSVSGGEVLMKDCSEEILRYIREEGKRRGIYHAIVVISNGRLMSERWLDVFKELDVHLSMSLPGYTTFAEHTGVDNADGVLHWFERAKEKGMATTLNVTVTKKNYHELFETLSLGLIHGASSVLLNRFLPGGRGLVYKDELMLTTEQVKGMLNMAEEVFGLANRYGSVGTEIPLCLIGNPEKYEHINIAYQCSAAKGFFVVGPSGEIRVCNHSPHIVGNIFAEGIIEDLEYWDTFANSQYKPDACSGCKAKAFCDCGCREVAGILSNNPKGVDPSMEIRKI